MRGNGINCLRLNILKRTQEKFNIEMWTDEKIRSFQKILMDWYDQQETDHNFPWRESGAPIIVSEIMLQQTRTDTVIPYYERFIEAFPTIRKFAEASEDQVLKMWEGLGYYSRARNLREAAQQIMIHHGGIFPNNPKEIIQLKGLVLIQLVQLVVWPLNTYSSN